MAKNGTNGTFSGPLVRSVPADTSAGSKIVDAYGRPASEYDNYIFGVQPDPIGKPAEAGVLKRDIPVLMINDWSETRMRHAIAAHMNGYFGESAYLCDAMIGDDRVAATLGQRMGALFSRSMKTTAVDGAQDVADAWDAAWEKFAPTCVLEELASWYHLLGFFLAEIQWDTTVLPWQPYLKPWHPTHVYYRWDIRKYVVTTMDGAEIITPGDGRWVLGTPHGPYRGWRRGAIRPCAVPWFARQLSWRDHARFNERHGLPIIKAKAPARSDATLRDNWVRGLSTLGQESVVLCPQMVDGTGYDAEMLEAKDRTWQSFGALADRADTAIVLSILWQNLTTEVDGGSYAAAKVHEGVKQTATRFDNNTLSETIYQQCARPFAAWNFGDPNKAPKKSWVIEEPSDHLTSAQAFAAFTKALSDLKAAGYQLTEDAVLALAFDFNINLRSLEKVIAPAPVDPGGFGNEED